MDMEELIASFYHISAKVNSIDLSANHLLRHLKIPALIELLTRLPAHIKFIKLSAGAPGFISPARMIELLTMISHTITACHSIRILNVVTAVDLGEKSADLSENELGSECAVNLARFLSCITATLDYLNLSDNDLGGISTSGLALILNAINKKLHSLDLSSNNLYCKGGIYLEKAFKCLPALYALDLSDNNFGKKYIVELCQAFSALPSCLTDLNLSSNNFWMLEPGDLGNALRALPRDLLVLNLSSNHLDEYTVTELKEIFANLPPHLTSLDLRGNGLEEKFGTRFYELLALVPSNIVHIAYDDRGFIYRAPPVAMGAGKGPVFFKDPPPDSASLPLVPEGGERVIAVGSG